MKLENDIKNMLVTIDFEHVLLSRYHLRKKK